MDEGGAFSSRASLSFFEEIMKVKLVQTWNRNPVSTELELQRGVAEILIQRGIAFEIEAKKKKPGPSEIK